MSGKLYIVGTPIGNLQDITLRAIETLKSVDYIAAEDTRHSLGLLNTLEIKKPMISCHKFNEKEAGNTIIKLVREGKDVALISDAGMPCISDPGAILVQKMREEGLDYTVIPGVTAVTSAMALSGITRNGFCFLGFLPEKKLITKLLSPYKNIDIQLVFYSAPHDVNDDLKVLFKHLGDRKVFVIKEITKMFERIEEGVLGQMEIETPRGEFVIIVEGRDIETIFPDKVEDHFANNMIIYKDKKIAIKMTAKERNVPKDDVYKIVMLCDKDK